MQERGGAFGGDAWVGAGGEEGCCYGGVVHGCCCPEGGGEFGVGADVVYYRGAEAGEEVEDFGEGAVAGGEPEGWLAGAVVGVRAGDGGGWEGWGGGVGGEGRVGALLEEDLGEFFAVFAGRDAQRSLALAFAGHVVEHGDPGAVVDKNAEQGDVTPFDGQVDRVFAVADEVGIEPTAADDGLNDVEVPVSVHI